MFNEKQREGGKEREREIVKEIELEVDIIYKYREKI